MAPVPGHQCISHSTQLRPGLDRVSNTGLGFTMGVFQVLGFAAFFALVLKRVEDEEEPVVPLLGHLSGPGNSAWVQAGG